MPEIETDTLPEKEYHLWNTFIRSAPQGTFFHHTDWADLIAMATGRPYRIIVCRHGSDIAAGIVVFDNTKWGLSMATPVPLFPFNGPLIGVTESAGEHKVIARTIQYNQCLVAYLTTLYEYWMLNTGYGFHDIRSFQWAGCQVEPVYTYQKNIQDSKDLEQTYNQSLRRKIREAKTAGIVVQETDATGSFLDLYRKSYRRHGLRPPVAEDLLEKILKMVIKLPPVKLLTAGLGNKILAGRLVLADNDVVYDLLAGGDDPNGLGATYLVHEILRRYAGTHKQFDFMGAGHRDIERFKRAFGGKLELGFQLTAKPRFPLSLLIQLRRYILTRRRQL